MPLAVDLVVKAVEDMAVSKGVVAGTLADRLVEDCAAGRVEGPVRRATTMV